MSAKSSQSSIPRGFGPVVKSGYLKKLKTSKRKYFVLRAGETCESSARLEYYDSEKKFNSGQLPKRSIPIKTCFNINKRQDMKHNKHVIALYTKDDCFCVILESEEDSDAWLKALLAQQQGEEVPDGVTPRPTFEHIWQVQLLNRGISTMVPGYRTTPELVLTHRLCLTDKTLSLIKQEENGVSQTDFPLTLIRSCGSLKNYFYLETGRSSVIGAGEIWMEAEDSHIASNIYHTVFNTMNSSSSREELAPLSRNRSSSANEASKPNNMPRRQTMAAGMPKPIPFHQHQAGNVAWPGVVNHQRTRSLPLAHPAPINTDNPIHPPKAAKRPTQSSKYSRIRCDSMPSRPRTSSEGNHPLMMIDRHWSATSGIRARDISHSPPSDSPVSPPSVECSTDSAGSSLSIDESEAWQDAADNHRRFASSLTPDEAIVEENCDDCADSPCLLHAGGNYMPMGHRQHQRTSSGSNNNNNNNSTVAPISSDDGYVDMSPRARHITMSPAASTSSVTSGTPSTDMRISEYPLEKVFSYIPSEEEENSCTERQRTYSMGSKPFRSRVEQPRNRACSVGSKTKKGYNRVLPPHSSHSHPSTKSSSVPLLINNLYSSHSSIDPMEDLVEMDFSRKPSDYVEMTPANPSTTHSSSSTQSTLATQATAKSKTPAGYVDMRPGAPIVEKFHPSPYVEMRPGTSPNKPIQFEPPRSEYMEMDGRANRMKPSTSPQNPSLSPLSSIASTSPLSQFTPTTDYMEMNFHPKNNNNLDMYVASPVRSTLSYINQGSPSSIDYIDMDYHPGGSKRDSEGYVEMSLGSSGKTPTTSASDYTNMSLGTSARKTNQVNHVKSKNESNTRSKPINIVQQPANSSDRLKMMMLPLQNNMTSTRSRKNSRRDSKDSSSSSVTTPSSSSIMFPLSLNSPCSPVCTKSPDAQASTSAGTSASSSTSSRIKVPSTVLNAKYQASGFRRDHNDYALMSFERPADQPSYVNYRPSMLTAAPTASSFNRPASSSRPAAAASTTPPEMADYALMQPGVGIIAELTPPDHHSARCFRPIDEESNSSGSSKQSRPGSESSEITLVGSRPNSVNSVGGHEPVATAAAAGHGQQQQLHYASLDLAASDSGTTEDAATRSQRAAECDTSGAPTEAAGTFTYAEIDFARSESFKPANSLMNTRVKH